MQGMRLNKMNYCFNAETIKNIENNFYKTADSSDILMERAGFALYEEIKSVTKKGNKITVLTGSGNNGGDGFVAARLLKENGYSVSVCQIFAPKTQLCKQKRNEYKGEVLPFSKELLFCSAVLVDCVFGTGFKGEISNEIKHIFACYNTSSAFKISADIPSGLVCDSQQLNEGAVSSDITLTFIGYKYCQLFFPSAENCGKVKLNELGLTKEFLDEYENFGSVIANAKIKKRKRNSHKGTFGTATLICGSEGMAGAAVLSAEACLRSGVGLARVVCHNSIYQVLTKCLPEALFLPLPQKANELKSVIENSQSVLIGCGLSTSNEAKELLKTALIFANKTLIIDADGINLLAHSIELLKGSKAEIILTPHPKEMARLCGVTVKEIEENRLYFAKTFAVQNGVTVVLKGAVTLVATPNGSVYFNTLGNSGMATGGSGDVLSGILVSLCAQGYSLEDAVKNAVILHAKAGDIAKEKLCEESLLASDIIKNLAAAFNFYKKQ